MCITEIRIAIPILLLMVLSFLGGVQFAEETFECRCKYVEKISGGDAEGARDSVREVEIPSVPVPTPDVVSFKPRVRRTLHEIGVGINSDKVVVHQYDVPYVFHFEGMREHKLRILEIGLGCAGLADVGLGIRLWGEYFNSSHLDVLEIDRDCGERYLKSKHKTAYEPAGGFTLHYGDQGDTAALQALAQAHGPWDIIIDDGSHLVEHQIATFTTLFPHLTPGGKYSIEDLQTSFWNGKWGNEGTAIHHLHTISRRVHTVIKKNARNEEEALDSKMKSPYRSVDCHHFVCIITKRS
eukprot:TRINITY_DN7603_c0_g1_i1.p1 TRINITY_DN7603_c0_g1~~TRINITY_DN7603_c0_g1_i1.p1  ORF type:complete len:296 (+),score=69.39 TRINITY_DN7603_c0_g1_i1:74-961(+)